MKKAELDKAMKKLDGFSVTIRTDYGKNDKPVERVNEDLIETIECMLVRLMEDDPSKEEMREWLRDVMVITLYNAGVMHFKISSTIGESEYNIEDIYENQIAEDF